MRCCIGRSAVSGSTSGSTAGCSDERDLAPLLDLDCSIVAGLESLRGPEALAAVLDRVGPDRLIVSLDLWAGRPITASPEAWDGADAETLAGRFVALGVRRILLLDLTRVGKGDGSGRRRPADGDPRVEPQKSRSRWEAGSSKWSASSGIASRARRRS